PSGRVSALGGSRARRGARRRVAVFGAWRVLVHAAPAAAVLAAGTGGARRARHGDGDEGTAAHASSGAGVPSGASVVDRAAHVVAPSPPANRGGAERHPRALHFRDGLADSA